MGEKRGRWDVSRRTMEGERTINDKRRTTREGRWEEKEGQGVDLLNG